MSLNKRQLKIVDQTIASIKAGGYILTYDNKYMVFLDSYKRIVQTVPGHIDIVISEAILRDLIETLVEENKIDSAVRILFNPRMVEMFKRRELAIHYKGNNRSILCYVINDFANPLNTHISPAHSWFFVNERGQWTNNIDKCPDNMISVRPIDFLTTLKPS